LNKNENKFLIYLAFAAIYVIWGSTYYFIFLGLKTIPPFMMMAIRFIISGLLLFFILKIQGKLIQPKPIDILKNAIYGTLLLVGGTGSVMWAEQYVPSGIASIVVCSLPFWFLVLDYPKWKVNFSNLSSLLGLIIGFIGVYILFSGNNSVVSSRFVLGISVITVGGIMWALGSLFSRYYPTSLSTLFNVAIQFVCAGIICSVISFFTNETDSFNLVDVSLYSWLSTLYLVVFGVVAYVAYLWLITKRSLILVGTYVYINPIIALFLGWLFANETISQKELFALFIILFGVVLINYRDYRTKFLESKRYN
jgi:drug/metabolite transporter (DMT)-like permease